MPPLNAISDLKTVLGDRLTCSKHDLEIHGRSEAHFSPMPPDAVAYPNTTAEVQAIVRACAQHDCPVIGWGTGTSLEGHALAVNGGICVDFSRMNKVLSINAEDMDVVIQPGVTRDALNRELRATGLFFPVDPGADASLGGMASTRASGTTTVRYGTMRDNVRGLEVVTADGRVMRTGSRAKKSASGYDLTGLFVGSEGTLGLITELTLKLSGIPEATATAICAFDTIEAAVNSVITTIQTGIPMARMEFVDGATAAAFNSYSGAKMPETPHLLVEFHGSDVSVAEDAAKFGEIVKDMGGHGFDWSAQEEDRRALWDMRHDAYYAQLSLRKGATAIVTDICVPISKLAEAVEETRADIDASPLMGPMLGHVGDGNFHCILLVEPGNASELKIANDLAHKMAKRALRMGGTVTGEHGVGMGKMKYMQDEHGDAWGMMGNIKRALDPQNIMNPGKLVQLN